MKKIIATFFMIGLLVGCTTANQLPIEPIPEITFKHLNPIALGALSIEIIDQTDKKPGIRYVGQRFPTSPKKAIENWVNDRLSARGTQGLVRVFIFEASAVEEKLEKTSGFKGLITDDQSEKYTTKLDVRIELDPQDGSGMRFASATVQRHITLAESLSLQEREWAWFALVENMMIDFDNRISLSMNDKLLRR